jgi:hypothetical protein
VCPNSIRWSLPQAEENNANRLPKRVKEHLNTESHKKYLKATAGNLSLVNMLSPVPVIPSQDGSADMDMMSAQEHFQLGFVVALYRSGLPISFTDSPLITFLGQFCSELNRLQSRSTLSTAVSSKVHFCSCLDFLFISAAPFAIFDVNSITF